MGHQKENALLAWRGVACVAHPATRGKGPVLKVLPPKTRGAAGKGGCPLAGPAPHVHAEPGAEPFTDDDLLLGRGLELPRCDLLKVCKEVIKI